MFSFLFSLFSLLSFQPFLRQYDFPTQRGKGGVEEYVHRIGRTGKCKVCTQQLQTMNSFFTCTGRAGRRGRAVTFFTEEEDAESAGPLVKMLMQSKKKIQIPKGKNMKYIGC